MGLADQLALADGLVVAACGQDTGRVRSSVRQRTGTLCSRGHRVSGRPPSTCLGGVGAKSRSAYRSLHPGDSQARLALDVNAVRCAQWTGWFAALCGCGRCVGSVVLGSNERVFKLPGSLTKPRAASTLEPIDPLPSLSLKLKWEGPFLSAMRLKPHLTFDQQVALLVERGLCCADEQACREFLRRANYYRFSGYARYFQVNPVAGQDQFLPGTSFEQIRDVYEADEQLRHLCFAGLQPMEVALRTAFAYHFSHLVGAEGALTAHDSFTSTGAGREQIADSVLRDLDRSKEPHVEHYATKDANTGAWKYDRLPVWSAVEALSFGTLSKCIEYSANPDVPRAVASELGVAWDGFTSQIRAFSYLRNRVAHHSRLWHHSVLDAPSVPNNVKQRAKKRFGQFDPRSVFIVLVALEAALSRAGLRDGFLNELVVMMRATAGFAEGITQPQARPER